MRALAGFVESVERGCGWTCTGQRRQLDCVRRTACVEREDRSARGAGSQALSRTCARSSRCATARALRRTSASTRAWRAACRTTPARSWRSPSRISPAASAAAGATTTWSACSRASRCPACGFSLGLERILVVMAERGMFPPAVAGVPPTCSSRSGTPERTPDALRARRATSRRRPARRRLPGARQARQAVQVRRRARHPVRRRHRRRRSRARRGDGQGHEARRAERLTAASRARQQIAAGFGASRRRWTVRSPASLEPSPRITLWLTNSAHLTRTHTCGALRAGDVGAQVTLLGWVHRVRDLGGVLFIDVRDRGGITQVVVEQRRAARRGQAAAVRVRRRRASGRCAARRPTPSTRSCRPAKSRCVADEIRVLNEAKTPPFPIADDSPVSEDVRLRYRYLDLRRPRLQHNIGLRHRVTMAMRQYFDAQGFWEIETPILTKSTPEGARDYLRAEPRAPGRVLRAAAIAADLQADPDDRRASTATSRSCKCFRDEDLRADRQPEFTQVDVEMSFARPEPIFGIDRAADPAHLPRDRRRGRGCRSAGMPYAEAMAKYGSDKPDLRFGLEIARRVARVGGGGVQRLPRDRRRRAASCGRSSFPARRQYSRSELDALVDQAKQLGAVGILWARRGEGGALNTNVKAAGEATLLASMEAAGCGPDDLILLAGGEPDAASKLLGAFRLSLAKKENLIPAEPLRVRLGRGLPAARVGRRREAVVARCTTRSRRRSTRTSAARERPRQRPREGLRPRAERQRDRRRQHPYPRRGRAEPHLPAARHQRRGGAAAVRLLRRGAASTGRRRMAASRSASTGSSPSWRARRRSARSSRSRRPPRPWI